MAREMKRAGFTIPLIIGGATTSPRHTAVKIAPAYDGPVIHVKDASRSVGVVDRLNRDETRPEIDRENRLFQEKERVAFGQQAGEDPPALRRRPEPQVRHRLEVVANPLAAIHRHPRAEGLPPGRNHPVHRLVAVLHGLGDQGEIPQDLRRHHPGGREDRRRGGPRHLRPGRELLDMFVRDKTLHANAVYGFFPANSDGDDVVLFTDESRTAELARFPMLRQQWAREGQKDFRSLADYVAPIETGIPDSIGAFALATGFGIEPILPKFRADHDDHSAIMTQSIADRLAEAFAELLHKKAREEWGFGRRRVALDRRADRREIPRNPPRRGLSRMPRPHREGHALEAPGRGEGHGHHPDRVVRHVPGRGRERALFRPSAGRATSRSIRSRATRSSRTPSARR